MKGLTSSSLMKCLYLDGKGVGRGGKRVGGVTLLYI